MAVTRSRLPIVVALLLGLGLSVALGTGAVVYLLTRDTHAPLASGATVRFHAVDDQLDHFVTPPPSELPSGLRLEPQVQPVGAGRRVTRRRPVLELSAGEDVEAARARARAWARTLTLPPDVRLVFIASNDVTGVPERLDGVLIRGAPLLTEADVAGAALVADPAGVGGSSLDLRFTELGARRLAGVSRKLLQRRLLVSVNGAPVSAPVIMTGLDGGRVVLTTDGDGAETLLRELTE